MELEVRKGEVNRKRERELVRGWRKRVAREQGRERAGRRDQKSRMGARKSITNKLHKTM